MVTEKFGEIFSAKRLKQLKVGSRVENESSTLHSGMNSMV